MWIGQEIFKIVQKLVNVWLRIFICDVKSYDWTIELKNTISPIQNNYLNGAFAKNTIKNNFSVNIQKYCNKKLYRSFGTKLTENYTWQMTNDASLKSIVLGVFLVICHTKSNTKNRFYNKTCIKRFSIGWKLFFTRLTETEGYFKI